MYKADMLNVAEYTQPHSLRSDTISGRRFNTACELVSITREELTKLRWASNYWKAQHERACKREDVLKKKVEHQESLIRDLRQRLFGKKSEKSGKGKDLKSNPEKPPPAKKPRGQKKGGSGHGRTQRPDLSVVEETLELPPDFCSCPSCGLPYDSFPGEEESVMFEIEVQAYKRKIYRKRYKKSCSCPNTSANPGIIVAPPAPKVIPRSPYGISIWEQVLLGKFLYAHPLNRILQSFNGQGLPISQGTTTGGLKKVAKLFEPIAQELYEKQMLEDLFHNDESRWEVFEAIEGKVGTRWYLWVTRSSSVIYYNMDPTRSSDVPIAHFSKLEPAKVIVVCDRYSAYKKMARLNPGIILAFCWTHVRRDFLELARAIPRLENWGMEWVGDIGKLYYLNQQRLECWQAEIPFEQQTDQFKKKHSCLQKHVEQMKERCDNLLRLGIQAAEASNIEKNRFLIEKPCKQSPEKLENAQRKVLLSLQDHWKGLTVFVTEPQVPMDNNRAEQAIRNPVCGRKNYYGSGSIWSAHLAAMMFSIFQTLGLWQLNSHHWLRQYLTACAYNGGKPPEDITTFLPWKMNEQRRMQLSKPAPKQRNTS